MTADPKVRTSSGGAGGQARTRLARAAVVKAARALFLEKGYAATTVEAISSSSDVPPATVYRLFSGKLGILKALLDTAIAGDDQAPPLLDRDGTRALLADADPVRQLSGFAGLCGQINERSAPVYRILLSAAGSDLQAGELLAAYTRQRQAGQGQIASALSRSGALRPGVKEQDAADIIHALMSPEVYRLLVDERAWPRARYEQWLRDILIDQLLAARR